MKKRFTSFRIVLCLLLMMVGVTSVWASELPYLTTDADSPVLYRIKNTRRTAKGTANYWTAASGITATQGDAAQVYFTGSRSKGVLTVKIHQTGTTTTLAQDFSWSDSGIDWYIKAHTSDQGGGYAGVLISCDPTFPLIYNDEKTGNGCWYLGSSNASPWLYGSQWDGSIFTLEVVDESQITQEMKDAEAAIEAAEAAAEELEQATNTLAAQLENAKAITVGKALGQYVAGPTDLTELTTEIEAYMKGDAVTAAGLTDYSEQLTAAMGGYTLNMPVAGAELRIYSPNQKAYIAAYSKDDDATMKLKMVAEEDDNGIFVWDGKNLINKATGYYVATYTLNEAETDDQVNFVPAYGDYAGLYSIEFVGGAKERCLMAKAAGEYCDRHWLESQSSFVAANTVNTCWQLTEIKNEPDTVDVTEKIVNQNFQVDGKTTADPTGWTYNPRGNAEVKGDASNYVITCYGSGFTVQQTLTGLEPGTYELRAQAFSRPKANTDTWTSYQNGEELENLSYIFANDNKKTTKLIVDETAVPASTSGWSELVAGEKYIPNGSAAFSAAFTMGMYENSVQAVVGEDGTLTIGFTNESTNSLTYAGVDNFRLLYLGKAKTDVTAITLSETTLELTPDHQATLKATVAPEDATEKGIVWSTSDETVATVDNGVVTAVAAGQATITATSKDNETITATCEVTVNEVPVTPLEEGQDITSMIVNPNFQVDGKTTANPTGWQYDPRGNAEVKGAADNYVITCYNGGFGVKQTLEGLPAGYYKLQAQAFSRPKANADTWTSYQNGEEMENLTYIFANESRKTVKLIVEDTAVPESTSGWTELVAGEKYIPNGSSAFSVAFTMGMYENEVVGVVGDNHKLTIGLYNTSTNSESYAGVDNFRLTYLGTEDPNPAVASVTLDQTEATLVEGQKLTLTPTVLPEKATVKTVTWTSSDEAVATVEDGVVTAVAPGKATITATSTENADIKATCEVTVEGVVIPTFEPGQDITSYIINPNFQVDGKTTANPTGWTYNPRGNAEVKGAASNYVITCYGSAFAISQTIENLPAGTYKMVAQAFSRPDSNENTWTAYKAGTEQENLTYIYANDDQKKVKLIVEDAMQPSSTDGWTKLEDGKYIPNGSSAFSVAFTAGLYDNEVVTRVGNDHKLTIGAYNTSTSSITYAGVDNFRLTYLGAESLYFKAQYDEAVAKLNAMTITYDNLNTYRTEQLAAAEAAAKDGTPEGYQTATQIVKEAIEHITELSDLYKSSGTKLENYMAVASQAEEHAAFDAVYEVAKGVLAKEDVTMAEMDEQMTAVRQAFAAVVKNGTTATGQFDMSALIDNGTFDKNLAGWTIANGTIEWKSAGVAGLVNVATGEKISQVLKGMPAGKYTLKVQGYYRPQGWKQALNNYENGNTDELKLSLFLNDKATPVQSLFEGARYSVSSTTDIFSTVDGRGFGNNSTIGAEAFGFGDYWNVLEAELTEDGDITIGLNLDATDLTDNWTSFDNFRLYYGTHNPVTLSTGKAYSQADPIVADVTLNLPIEAGVLTPLCVPFDIPAEQFKAVYNVGAINGTTATLYPVAQVKAGVPCVVLSENAIESVEVKNATLIAAKADKKRVAWQGGLITPYYSKMSWQHVPVTGASRVATASNFTYETQDIMDMNFTANTMNHRVRSFIDKVTYTQSSASVIGDYNLAGPGRRDIPHPVVIPVPANEAAKVVVEYSTNDDMSEAVSKTVYNGATVCFVPNLVPLTRYYYEVKADEQVISKGQFDVEGQVRMIYAPSVYNVRDLGGWTVKDNGETKTVRYGLIYRGAGLNGQYTPTTALDIQSLKDIGIGAEIDLRWKDGYDRDDQVGISAFGFTEGNDFYAARANDYTAANMSEAETQGRLKEEFQFILKHIREGRGVYYHCAFGADRTGLLTVLLEGLMGYPLNAMYKDYELTTFSAMSSSNRVKSAIQERIAVVQALSGSTLRDKFDTYFKDKLGVSQEEIEEFRSIMLYDGIPTAIQDVELGNEAQAGNGIQAVYTLGGTRVPTSVLTDASRNGIYVVKYQNGTARKVLK